MYCRLVIIDALIPALDEEASLPGVLRGLEGRGLRRVVVVDNGSTDDTAGVAAAHGAEVTAEPRRGYGAACLTGLRYLLAAAPEVVVFLDADGADHPDDLDALLAPIRSRDAEMVVGSRVLGEAERGALTPVQTFGNVLSTALLGAIWEVRFTDLGPFRAVTWGALGRMMMTDPDFGWTVEMQARAARLGVPSAEVPVRYRRRAAGRSKVSGSVRGSVRAGTKILWTIGRELWT
ncbi:MAG: glycosyltransferase family 2 protein [Planctomycetota bacterium]